MNAMNVKKTQYGVSDFASWQKAGSLELSPIFQRRSVWKPGAKSYFIDTLARGLPVPIVILREKRSDLSRLEPMREVVDGQQRIRTVFSYIDDSLLKDYSAENDYFQVLKDHNKELAGLIFKDLPKALQHRILDYEFSVHILPAETDDREVLQIFARLNATGYKLTYQELRNAEFFGPFKTSMYTLAAEQLNRWRDWNIFTDYNISRMEEVELASEFALMMVRRRIQGKSKAILDKIYKEFDEEFPKRREIERRFRRTMDTIEDRFGTSLLTSPFSRKTLFFSLFAFVNDVQFGIESELKRVRPRAMTSAQVNAVEKAAKAIEGARAPKAVLEATSRRTTHPSSRQAILRYLHNLSRNA